MVNTFLISSDFSESAKALDWRRLGKQRVEANQILSLIYDLLFLSKLFNYPLPSNSNEDYNWIREIAKKYKSLPYRFVVKRLISLNKKEIDKKEIEKKISKKEINIDKPVGCIYIRYNRRITDRIPKKASFKKSVVIEDITFNPSDRVVSLGFVYHPAVQMWLRYPDALRLYINEHIKEWINRGFNNNLPLYILKDIDKIKRPKWTSDKRLHRNHRAALLAKEIDRKEEPWYINKPDFVNAGPFIDYIWPITK